jgi:tRNA(His) 5'-end guanylyltransferase
MADSLGDRIKRYESSYAHRLVPRSCVLVRVDGKSFHTFTKGCEKPFDQNIIDAMVIAASETAAEMQGFKLAYVQSDEATFLLQDFDTLQTQGWFDYELNKIVSISASMFTAHFNRAYGSENPAYFDSRAFVVPEVDWPNAFLWRQRDWERNSLQMLARAHFSHKQVQGKKAPELHDMLHEKGVHWAYLDDQLKNGTFILRDGSLEHGKQCYEGIRTLVEGFEG